MQKYSNFPLFGINDKFNIDKWDKRDVRACVGVNIYYYLK